MDWFSVRDDWEARITTCCVHFDDQEPFGELLLGAAKRAGDPCRLVQEVDGCDWEHVWVHQLGGHGGPDGVGGCQWRGRVEYPEGTLDALALDDSDVLLELSDLGWFVFGDKEERVESKKEPAVVFTVIRPVRAAFHFLAYH